MKKLTILVMLSFGFFLIVANLFAQVETVEDPNAVATITPEEIIQLGQNVNAPSNGIIVLNFEGLGNADPINDFYNGGTSGQGYSGANYGVQFGVALGLIDEDAGGTGNFGNEPSPETVMFFLDENQAYMNVMAGFTTGFSFYYATLDPCVVEVYDGLNGTGNLLGSATCPSNNNGSNCTGDPNGFYCQWDVVSVPFTGTAKSVVYIGAANYCAFDEVTFGSTTPGEPVPISNWSIVIVVLLIGTAIWFRRFR
ncbi:MAG: hypothetical protein R2764_00920 [Bacteroidales bacterium]